MYKKISKFVALSLIFIALTPEMVSAKISQNEQQLIQSQNTSKQTLSPAKSLVLLEQLRTNSRVQAAKASYQLSIIAVSQMNLKLAHTRIKEAIQLSQSNLNYLKFASDIAFKIQNYDEAGDYQRVILKIAQSALKPDYLQVADVLDQLGAIYFAQENYQQSQTSLKESLQLRAKVLGESHLLVAKSLNKLATLAIRQQQPSVAELLLKKSLSVVREVSGNRSTDSAVIQANLAYLYHSEKRLEEAEVLYKEAISIWADSAGDPLRRVNSRNSLGRMLLGQQRIEDARLQFKQVLSLLQQNYAPDHPYVQQARRNLAALDGKREAM